MYFILVIKMIPRLFQRKLRTCRFGTVFSLLVTVSLATIAIKLWKNVHPHTFDNYSRRQNCLPNSKNSLAIFVVSDRESFDRRNSIRNTWAFGHDKIFFVVGGQYSPYPLEHRVLTNNSLSKERLKLYMEKEDMITRRLLGEQDVILVPSSDNKSELEQKIKESYRWALRTLRAEWFLHVEDSLDVNVNELENYLKTSFQSFENAVIISSVKHKFAIARVKKSVNRHPFQGEFMCGMNHVVSRDIARYAISRQNFLFEYIQNYSYNGIRFIYPFSIKLDINRGFEFILKEGCTMITTFKLNLLLKNNMSYPSVTDNSLKTTPTNKDIDTTFTLIENPSTYLYSDRFDLIVKIVYAHFYVFKTRVPKVIKDAYIEHLKVWNNFSENSDTMNKDWYDAKQPFKEKRSSSDFISAFHNTIDTIKKFGFNSTLSRIPVDKTGFLLNGAHRLAASIVLSKSATFEHQNYEEHFPWGYVFFKSIGLSERTFDLVMLEWMKLQLELPYLKKTVSIVTVFSNIPKEDDKLRKFVKERCSHDNGILFEKQMKFSKNGARQLITHMYGQHSWDESKIKQMLSKFKFSTSSVLFLFVFGKDKYDLLNCKNEIRHLYNDNIFKSTVHIPDTADANLILAEMILNSNSIQFMNHAKNASDCNLITKEIASRSGITPIKTLPGMYIGRDDIMIDTGAVLGIFGLRQRTDVDIMFLQDVDNSILGESHGLTIHAHTFKYNSISKELAWRKDHFNEEGPENHWNLFYDPKNYGYCYGIKFISLQQQIRYKLKRNEFKNDQFDIHLINTFLKSIEASSCSKALEVSYKVSFLSVIFLIFVFS